MVQKIIPTLCVLALTAVFFKGTWAVAEDALIRVAVLREVDKCTLYVDGRYSVIDPLSGKVLTAGIHLKPALVKLEGGHIVIGAKFYDQGRLTFEPRQDAMVSVNNMHFRGSVTVINNGGKSLTVVNSVDLEEYIRGVLYHEVSDKWPMDAMKAQAVATRTFALYSAEKFASRDYDLTNDIYSQVYGGRAAERYRTNLAVKRTKGEVLNYKGKIFPAFFHANSGGITEDAKELWDITDIAPLKGNVVSPLSVDAPHYRWKVNFRLKDIQEKLNARGHIIGEINTIKVASLTKSGRVRQLFITDREGASLNLDGKVFRDIIGPNQLKSNKYAIDMQGWYVDFKGLGWGHGVGMCQWGAYGMAKQHYNYTDILSFYYPSSELVITNNNK